MKLVKFWILAALLLSPNMSSREQVNEQSQRLFLQQFILNQQFLQDQVRLETINQAARLGLPVRFKAGPYVDVALQRFRDKRPLYYKSDNLTAADTSATDELWAGASLGLRLSGLNQVLGIWDGGSVRVSHQEFVGVIDIVDQVALSHHATHVAGTMLALGSDPLARGMAFASRLKSYDFNLDTVEMAQAQLESNPVTISNHSYGYISGWFNDFFSDGRWAWFGDVSLGTTEDNMFGYYDDSARQWDLIAYNSPNYLIVKSAGNDRKEQGSGEHWHFDGSINNFVLDDDIHPADGGVSGFDSISGGSASAKNILTIGAVNDIVGGYQQAADVRMASFSGWGPTDDGRIKPDLVANGIQLYSSVATSDTAYTMYSGTSMSSAIVSGSLSLLSQHAQDLFSTKYRSATLKALVINTADESGSTPGPDYEYGWGLLNTASAAALISAEGASAATEHIYEIELLDGNDLELTFSALDNAVIKVTLVWTDPPAEPAPASIDPVDLMLQNDLDLRITGPAAQLYMPWVLDPQSPDARASQGDNFRDNVEQIAISNAVNGDYQLSITHKGALVNGTAQKVSLVISGNIATQDLAPSIVSTPSLVASVANEYQYDSNNTVQAIGSVPIIYSLILGPLGMTVSTGGVVSWTPLSDQQGAHPVEIMASNALGSDRQSYIISVSGVPEHPIINFNHYILGYYAGAQDKLGSVLIEDAGATLHLIGNRWQQISYPYILTSDTMLEFDFFSDNQGDIHGIGFDTDKWLSIAQLFTLYGTQLVGMVDFANYNVSSGWQHYVIPVGQYYTGAMQHLFFTMDHDVSNPTGDSRFSNIAIYQANALPPTAPTITSLPAMTGRVGIAYQYDSDNTLEASGTSPINFSLNVGPSGMTISNAGVVSWTPTSAQEGIHALEIMASNGQGSDLQNYSISVSAALTHPAINFNTQVLGKYAGSQDRIGSVLIEAGGARLHLIGNRWQQISFPYIITANTILEFDFASDSQGEIHGIGFDTDLTLSVTQLFTLYGSQLVGIVDFANYSGNGSVQHYVIPVGQYYSGAMNYLFFVMDHDISNASGDSQFSNIMVYEN
jgi:hypothetical protein